MFRCWLTPTATSLLLRVRLCAARLMTPSSLLPAVRLWTVTATLLGTLQAAQSARASHLSRCRFDLVTEVTERFMADDVDPEEEKVFVVSPAGARKLLQLTEATSGDLQRAAPSYQPGLYRKLDGLYLGGINPAAVRLSVCANVH